MAAHSRRLAQSRNPAIIRQAAHPRRQPLLDTSSAHYTAATPAYPIAIPAYPHRHTDTSIVIPTPRLIAIPTPHPIVIPAPHLIVIPTPHPIVILAPHFIVIPTPHLIVIPAKAGIYSWNCRRCYAADWAYDGGVWIPAFAGMTIK